ncbi:hypothetical protein HHK36_032344 [Tetracentron sinense]|uniref:Pentatricopeptide repeat-containing protein n=1 Tax=Tetracentron sinense TaxID=13715 RepID=A0A834Y9B8_TETSI|nr:hypothetical protein HHK36_032344 [Tetracentron sinense]
MQEAKQFHVIRLRAYASSSDPHKALHLYTQLHKHGPQPDNCSFPLLLKACFSLRDFQIRKEIHCQAIKHGFESDIFEQNSLIHLYGLNAKIKTARRIFDEMEPVEPNDSTIMSALCACANLGALDMGRWVHSYIRDKGTEGEGRVLKMSVVETVGRRMVLVRGIPSGQQAYSLDKTSAQSSSLHRQM